MTPAERSWSSSPYQSVRGIRIALAAVLVATVIAYWPAFRGVQLLDDMESIGSNTSIHQLWPLSIPLHPEAQTAVSGRPVVNYSLALNYWINDALGVDQRTDRDDSTAMVGFHVVNLLIHLGCGLLLFGIVRRTMGSGKFGERWQQLANPAALLVVAFWLLHPLQTDAVDYLVQRTELLVSFFYAATLYASIRAWDAATRPATIRWFAIGSCAALLGMGSKEVMVSAPLMIVLYDRAFRLESWRELRSPALRARRWFYAALCGTLLLLVALMASGPRSQTVGFHGKISPLEYLHSQGWAISHYLRLMLIPNALSLDYGPYPLAHWRGAFGLVLLALLGAVTIYTWVRRPREQWLAFLGSWFFLLLAPSSSFVPILSEIAAERRVYLAFAAVIVLCVVGVDAMLQHATTSSRWFAQRRLQIGAVFASVVLLLVLSTVTYRRSMLYRSPERIWRDAVVHAPDNARAWNNLAVIVGNTRMGDGSTMIADGRLSEANAMLRHALGIDAGYLDARFYLIENLVTQRQFSDAAAELAEVPATESNRIAGFGSTVLAHGDTAGALLILTRAAVQPPDEQVLVEIAAIYIAAGRPGEAIPWLRRATTMAPNRKDLQALLNRTLEQAGHAAG